MKTNLEKSKTNKKQIIFIIIFLLTVIAFFLRVLPFGYGMAHIYFSDTPLFSKALKLAEGFAQHDFSQFTSPSYYPYFFSYIFLFVFGIFYLIGVIGGIFSSANEFFKYAILQMEQLFEISRIIIAVAGTLLIPLVYLSVRKILLVGKRRWVEVGALFSAFLMCFSVLHINYSHFVRPHLAVAFTLFLSFYFYLILLEKKNLISYILLGIASGLAIGTLHNGFLAISFLIIAHFFIRSRQNNKKIFSFPFIAGLIAFLLVFSICWPYLILNMGNALGLGGGKFDITLSGRSHTLQGYFTGEGLIVGLKGLVLNETGLVILLIIFLIIYFVSLQKKRKDEISVENSYYKTAIKGGVFMLIAHFVIFGMYSIPSYRFLVPLIPFLCVFIGILFGYSLEKISTKYRPWLIVLVAIVLIFPIVQSIRLTTLIARKDTRDLAAEWIEKNIDPSQMIAISSKGPKLFPNKESLEKKLLLAGPDSLGQRDNLLLSFSKEEYPQQSRSIFPLWAFDENQKKIYDFLKNQSDYFVFDYANSYPGIDPTRDAEQQMAIRLGILVKTFNPFRKISNVNSLFPGQIENPIINLWVLERMGPVIEIYKIKH